MAINQSLLEILVCPEDKSPLHVADNDLVSKINVAVENGTLTNKGGKKLAEKIDSGLIREDGKILYPIRHDIPIMLIEEGIPLGQVNS